MTAPPQIAYITESPLSLSISISIKKRQTLVDRALSRTPSLPSSSSLLGEFEYSCYPQVVMAQASGHPHFCGVARFNESCSSHRSLQHPPPPPPPPPLFLPTETRRDLLARSCCSSRRVLTNCQLHHNTHYTPYQDSVSLLT